MCKSRQISWVCCYTEVYNRLALLKDELSLCLLRIDPQTLSVFVSFEDVTSEPEVLVIDDDQNLVNLMVLGLQEQGFRASGSITSVDGLMQVSDLQPTCIVVDLKMPGVEGLDLVQALCSTLR